MQSRAKIINSNGSRLPALWTLVTSFRKTLHWAKKFNQDCGVFVFSPHLTWFASQPCYKRNINHQWVNLKIFVLSLSSNSVLQQNYILSSFCMSDNYLPQNLSTNSLKRTLSSSHHKTLLKTAQAQSILKTRSSVPMKKATSQLQTRPTKRFIGSRKRIQLSSAWSFERTWL